MIHLLFEVLGYVTRAVFLSTIHRKQERTPLHPTDRYQPDKKPHTSCQKKKKKKEFPANRNTTKLARPHLLIPTLVEP
jgi:hypothetical protein